MQVDIVIPVFNQLVYTKQCLETLLATVPADTTIIVVNNGSADGTFEYLNGLGSRIIGIHNEENRGCAPAWNQGVRAGKSQWTVILNNDIVLPHGWLEGLLAFAEENKLDVVSPALREGDLNYDIAEYSRTFTQEMASVSRMGEAHGVCFAVRRQVFSVIGYFDENFRIGQFEDADFFQRVKQGGFRLAITGRSFIHHFGSVTQKSFRKRKMENPYVAENRAYFRKKWNLTWWRRLWLRRSGKLQNFVWRNREKVFHGHSLVEKWIDGRLRYY